MDDKIFLVMNNSLKQMKHFHHLHHYLQLYMNSPEYLQHH